MQERATLAFAAAPEGADGTTFQIDADGYFGVEPFKIPCGNHDISRGGFALSAPSTKKNAARIMRAMQLSKPILLEGSPGVGKTSIISALAAASGHKLVRLNLSEQTDMMDLLGADLPAAGGAAGEFVWSDGAFLAALKAGDWVLLDELNLAPQPVLEGLNAVLDHRAEVFVPELGQTFRCPPTFRVFAAQNPVQEGGGRKGLPKSFLNRFTRVHVEPMCADDLHHIYRALHHEFTDEIVSAMVRLIASLAHAAPDTTAALATAVVWCGAVTCAYTIWAQSFGQRGVTAARATLVYTSQPVFSALFAFGLLHEVPTAATLAGGGLGDVELSCRFGDEAAVEASIHGAEAVRCVSPVAPLSGWSSVELVSHGQTLRSGGSFFSHARMWVSAVAPLLGPVEGGTRLTLLGAHFREAATLRCRFEESLSLIHI